MDAPFFSVVMATFDRGRHILPSVRSVLGQEWPGFELIVVGDGCTDDTADLLRDGFGDRLRWINLPARKGSQSFPNNAGIAAAKGSHIAYLGHDDLWAPDHLGRLAALFRDRSGVDIGVSGCAFHLPHGMAAPFITGLFEDAATPRTQFFPPSSFAHRRDVTDRIGPWRDPFDITAPVDCDLLLRAVADGMRFASTGRVTTHKFAAGHRYLSYLHHDSDEQEALLHRLAAPDHAEWVQSLIRDSRAAGRFMAMPYTDFAAQAPGDLARTNLARKGLRAEARRLADEQHLAPSPLPDSFDWHSRPERGFLWHAGNPRPRVLLPFCGQDQAVIVMDFAHARPEAIRHVVGRANGQAVEFRMTPALPVGPQWMATGMAVIPLRRDQCTALELHLSPDQQTTGTAPGIGYGRIVALPLATALGAAAADQANANGIAAHAKGDAAAALAAFRDALRASPLHAVARANLALVLNEIGQRAEAAAQGLTAAALAPATLAAWVALARVALAEGAAGAAQVIATHLDGLPDGTAVAVALRQAVASTGPEAGKPDDG